MTSKKIADDRPVMAGNVTYGREISIYDPTSTPASIAIRVDAGPDKESSMFVFPVARKDADFFRQLADDLERMK